MAGPARLTPTGLQPGSAETFSTYVQGLPSAKTPLTGNELVPIIQGGFPVHAPPGQFGPPQALTPATSNLTFYVNVGTGSDSNNGLAPATAFATIQHALNVTATFDYGNQFFPTVNVADGSYPENLILPFLVGAVQNGNATTTGNLVGNLSTPTNCRLTPNNTSASNIMFWAAQSFWSAGGFSLVADPVNGSNGIGANTYSQARLGNFDFNFGSTQGFGNLWSANNFGRISSNGNYTFQGTANPIFGGFCFAGQKSFLHVGDVTWTFNSHFNMGGASLFEAGNGASVLCGGITFVNSSNVTGAGSLFQGINVGIFDTEGVDPTTVTWPGNPSFNPIGLDPSSSASGFQYAQVNSAAPVDQSTIFRGSWVMSKTTGTPTGTGINLYVDDAGTVVPLIALTPAPGNLTFFVATTGSDSNPGTSGSPFRTIQHAVSVALGFDYQSLWTCTINVANGTYHEHPVVLGLVNAVNPTTIVSVPFSIIGNTGTPTNCVISPNTGGSASVISFITGNFQFDGFSLVADTTSAGSDALLEITNEATVTIPTGMDFNMPLAAAGLYSFGVRSSLWSRFAAISSSMTFQGTGWNGSNGIMNGLKWSNVSIGAATLTFNSAINMGGNPVFQGLFDAAIQFNSGGSVPTFVNPGNVTGMPPISLISGSQSLIGVDPLTITWPGGTFDPTQIDGSSNIDGFFYGIQNAGQLVDETSIYRGSWRIFKDTTNVRRYLAYDDGGTIYVKQIGRVPNTQAGTPYVLALSDQDGRVEMSNAGANQLTVPANATVAFPIGTEIRVVQVGAGATTIAGAVGVTVDAAGVVGGQWKSVMLYKRGTNEWVQTNV